jgi:hypothetical protein
MSSQKLFTVLAIKKAISISRCNTCSVLIIQKALYVQTKIIWRNLYCDLGCYATVYTYSVDTNVLEELVAFIFRAELERGYEDGGCNFLRKVNNHL